MDRLSSWRETSDAGSTKSAHVPHDANIPGPLSRIGVDMVRSYPSVYYV